MTWAKHHAASEHAANEATLHKREGRIEKAVAAYRRAAAAEERALAAVDRSKVRTLGITAVSTVALWYKARDLKRAENVAYRCLAENTLPDFARRELRDLLQRFWSEAASEEAGIRFVEGDVVFGVRGGEIVYGGAPLDLVVEKVGDVRALYYRTAELLSQQPLRKRGLPAMDIQQLCRPWLFQAPPSSYTFAIRIQEPEQMSLFPSGLPRVLDVATTFLDILRATAGPSPDESLQAVVPDAGYRDAFLRLARNLAPTGDRYGQLEVRAAGAPSSESVLLLPGNRDTITGALRKSKPGTTPRDAKRVRRIIGILRALHLDQDWLEVAEGSVEGTHIKVFKAGDALDDVVGPMVNRRVVVEVRETKRGRFEFVDIELDQ